MRRIAIVGLALLLVGMLAGEAQAAKTSVNAALNIVGWGNSGQACAVLVDDFSANEVNALCYLAGSTWFTVRVAGVGAGALEAKAFGKGDCSGKIVSVKRKVGGVAIVKVRNVGSFDCTYKSVTVKW